MDNTYIKTFGEGKIYVQHNGDQEMHAAKWDLDYDGDKMDIDVHMNNDGKKEHIHETLNNEEIQNILQKNSTKGDLQQRLRHDFIVDQKIYKIVPLREKPSAVLAVKKRIPSKIPSIKSSKRKSSKRKSSTKKSSMRKTHKRKTSKRKTTKKTSSSSSSKKSSRRSSRIERIRRQVKKHLATPRPKIKRIHLTK